MNLKILFVHIDKTGGMSLREFLAQQYKRDEIFPVAHDPRAAYKPVHYRTVPRDLRDSNRKDVMYIQPHHKLVMGHLDCGQVLRHFKPDLMITVLRDPAERAASLYAYICEQTHLYPALSNQAAVLTFEQFLVRMEWLYANHMTRQLAGVRWSQALGSIDMVAEARLNLDRSLVGITGKLDVMVDYLRDRFGMVGELDHVNRTSTRPAISDEARQIVAERSALDVEIYEYAKERANAITVQ